MTKRAAVPVMPGRPRLTLSGTATPGRRACAGPARAAPATSHIACGQARTPRCHARRAPARRAAASSDRTAPRGRSRSGRRWPCASDILGLLRMQDEADRHGGDVGLFADLAGDTAPESRSRAESAPRSQNPAMPPEEQSIRSTPRAFASRAKATCPRAPGRPRRRRPRKSAPTAAFPRATPRARSR